MDYENIYNLFKAPGEKAVTVPPPVSLLEGHIKQAALTFGRPVEDDYRMGAPLLYGARDHGSGGYAAAADEDKKKNGFRLWVPCWVTHLEGLFYQVSCDEGTKAYQRGFNRGKSLLYRLGTGDLSVLDFEQRSKWGE
jgi:hypothetical protein